VIHLKIEIKTDNEAFANDNKNLEIARILHKLAHSLEIGNEPARLMDINGNVVGTVEY